MKNHANVKLMGVKVQGRAAGKRIGESYFNFLSELQLFQRTYGPKMEKKNRAVFEKNDFVEIGFSPLPISKWLAGPKIRSQIEKAIKNCSTLSVIAVVHGSEQFLEVFSLRDLGLTLTLTFKVKVMRPHRDLSNKKKIIDLSHTVTEIHAFEVHTYYIGPMF